MIKSVTISVCLKPDLNKKLEKSEQLSLIEEARKQSLLAAAINPDNEIWEANTDQQGWVV